jgi:hypothetical protein
VLERHLGDERQRVEVGGAEDELVGVAGGRLHIDKGFGATAAALRRYQDRLIDQVVFLDDRLDRAVKDVGAAARPCRAQELDRLRWLPFGLGRVRGEQRDEAARENHPCLRF